MHAPRRHALARAALASLAALAGLAAAGPAAAQPGGPYPVKPITLIVPTAPGGTTDIAARMLAEPLGKALGQTVIVDNRGGASGALAAVAVKRAEPDGYTLLMQYSGYHVITPYVSRQPAQWEAKDLQPVANVLSAPQVVVVREGLPVKTMAELIAFAKKEPGKVTYASSGNGSLQHVTGAMIEQQAGVQLTHVPYKGTGPALSDLVGGHIPTAFAPIPASNPLAQGGQIRMLAVTSAVRSTLAPDVPTIAEQGVPGFDAVLRYGVVAPAGTPRPIIEKINKALNQAIASDEVRKRLALEGAEPLPSTPQEYAADIDHEATLWARIVKLSGAKAD
jgi:tripartite-type tricarboxylate transporter receptor subunit TctC